MKVLVLGRGFVSEHLPYQKLDERIQLNTGLIKSVLDEYKPDAIINCIGKTGRPNVDWCESNQAETYLANVTLPSLLASVCADYGIHFIQIGSGCIYFGESPYKGERPGAFDPGWRESNMANPKSFYSKTKYACDLTIGSLSNVTTLRIRMPISTKNNPRNFINKVRGYSQVIDIPNSVTFMDDFVRCVDWIIKERKTGTFHVTNPEPISAAQTMQEYQKYVPEHKFSIIDEQELDSITVAKRSNCILNTDKLRQAGFLMTPSEEALKQCMATYIKNI